MVEAQGARSAGSRPTPPPHTSYDPACLETLDWQASARVDAAGGPWQPFYQVLVDVRDWAPPPTPDAPFAAVESPAPVAYVPQSRLAVPPPPGEGREALEEAAEFVHPFAYLLFLGGDDAGDLIPTAALRSRYGVARRDVFPPGSEGEGEGLGGPD